MTAVSREAFGVVQTWKSLAKGEQSAAKKGFLNTAIAIMAGKPTGEQLATQLKRMEPLSRDDRTFFQGIIKYVESKKRQTAYQRAVAEDSIGRSGGKKVAALPPKLPNPQSIQIVPEAVTLTPRQLTSMKEFLQAYPTWKTPGDRSIRFEDNGKVYSIDAHDKSHWVGTYKFNTDGLCVSVKRTTDKTVETDSAAGIIDTDNHTLKFNAEIPGFWTKNDTLKTP